MKETLKSAVAKANEKLGKVSERFFALPSWAQKGIYIGIGVGVGILAANLNRIHDALTGATYIPGLDVNGDGIRDYSFWPDNDGRGVYVFDHGTAGYKNWEEPGIRWMHIGHSEVTPLAGTKLTLVTTPEVYKPSCPDFAKKIIDAVGGPGVVDRAKFPAIDEKCLL